MIDRVLADACVSGGTLRKSTRAVTLESLSSLAWPIHLPKNHTANKAAETKSPACLFYLLESVHGILDTAYILLLHPSSY